MPVSHSTSSAFTTTFVAAQTARNFAFDAGSGTNNCLFVGLGWQDSLAHTISGASYNGTALASMSARIDQGAHGSQCWYLVNPSTGSNTLTITPSTGAGVVPAQLITYVAQGVDQTTPFVSYLTAQGADAAAPFTTQIAPVSTSTQLVVVFHFADTGASDAGAVTADGYTERVNSVFSRIGASSGDTPGASLSTTTATHATGNINWSAHGFSVNAVAAAGIVWPGVDLRSGRYDSILQLTGF